MPINDPVQGNTQHAVPQNIMDVEFKLIGDLTMRQFFYLMIFSGIAYAAFTLKIPLILRWPTIIGSVLLGLGFAFIPIEDRGFDEWIVNFFRAIYQENQRIWKKEPTPPSAFLQENMSIVKQELITLAPTSSRRKLEQYLSYQQPNSKKIDPLDIPEQAFIEKIHNAYIDYKPQPSTTVAIEEPIVTIEPFEQQHIEEFQPQGQKQEEKENKEEQNDKQKEIKKTENQEETQKEKVVESTFKPIQVIKKRKLSEPARPKVQSSAGSLLAPITPDRHSGRKFTNLLGSVGNIVLPIRGEKVLAFGSDTNEADNRNTEEKAERLKQYLEQIKQVEKGYSTSRNETQVEVTKQETKSESEETIEEGRFTDDIKKQMADIQKENTNENKKEDNGTQEKQVSGNQITSDEVPIPNIPNVISGKIKDKENKGLQNILLIIKNAHNDPVRAIKTNALGHFAISNPLPNGTYKINVDVNKESGLSFDIIDIEARGEIIQPIEIAGK